MRRRLIGVAVLIVAGAGCSSDSSSADASVPDVGPDGVLIQLGSYEIGGVPDEFVWGPQIVVLGDGRVNAELYDGVTNGQVVNRLVVGQLTDSQLLEVVAAAKSLPADGEVGERPVDGAPLLLAVGERRWAINDLSVEPFRAFVAELTELVSESATQTWEPPEWIVKLPGNACTNVEGDPGEGPYDAPVFPHVLDEGPLAAC